MYHGCSLTSARVSRLSALNSSIFSIMPKMLKFNANNPKNIRVTFELVTGIINILKDLPELKLLAFAQPWVVWVLIIRTVEGSWLHDHHEEHCGRSEKVSGFCRIWLKWVGVSNFRWIVPTQSIQKIIQGRSYSGDPTEIEEENTSFSFFSLTNLVA